MSKKNIIIWIICLVVADQGIKIIIANFFFDSKFDIIESVFGFCPVYNDKFSYVNASLSLKLGLLPHAILFIFAQILMIFLYDYFKIIHRSKLSDFILILGQSILCCVFCGFFLWKDGILDYIFIYPVVCDLKDLYINSFLICLFCYHFKYRKKIHLFKTKEYFSKRWIDIKQFLTKS